jgi:hypothetical protein
LVIFLSVFLPQFVVIVKYFCFWNVTVDRK